jgi:protein TonB
MHQIPEGFDKKAKVKIMKTKKSKNADVERFRGLFFRIGLVISILSVVFAFKWTTQREVFEIIDPLETFVDEPIDSFIRIIDEKPKPKMAKLEIVDVEPVIDPLKIDLFIVDLNLDDSFSIIPIIEDPEPDPGIVESHFIPLENRPKFPGDEKALSKFLGKNIVYPALEKEIGLQGLVTLHFVVKKDGRITDVTVIKGVSPNIDAEAIRVVEAMPNWIPGKQRDRNVDVSIMMPIRFTLSY